MEEPIHKDAVQSATRNSRRAVTKKIHRHACACKLHRACKERKREPALARPRWILWTPLCAARHKGEIISTGRVISRQSRRLSLAYQSRMLFFFFSFSFPSLPSPMATGVPRFPLPIPCASPRRSPRPYLVSRGPSASTRLWRRGKYVRTSIGAISISPDSNLGSLERGECASFAVHVTRATYRRMGDKKERIDGGREGYGLREKKKEGASIARCA